MSDNGRPQQLEAELTIRWNVGAHMPKQMLMPKGVTLASIIGMLRLAEKLAIEQFDTSSSKTGIIIPPGNVRR